MSSCNSDDSILCIVYFPFFELLLFYLFPLMPFKFSSFLFSQQQEQEQGVQCRTKISRVEISQNLLEAYGNQAYMHVIQCT